MSGYPNSFNHCPPCTFTDLSPEGPLQAEDETRGVINSLFNLGLGEGSDQITLDHLNAKQQMAARGCAATILRGECRMLAWSAQEGRLISKRAS